MNTAGTSAAGSTLPGTLVEVTTSDQSPRRRLRVELPQPVPPPAARLRTATWQDIPALGALMFAAYQDTPDAADAGDTVADATHEISMVFAAEHGQMLPEASFIASDQTNRPIAATLVTIWKGEPLLAYVFTAPQHRGQGLATTVITATMHTLGRHGHPALNLAVTDANTPAASLYNHLGFQRV